MAVLSVVERHYRAARGGLAPAGRPWPLVPAKPGPGRERLEHQGAGLEHQGEPLAPAWRPLPSSTRAPIRFLAKNSGGLENDESPPAPQHRRAPVLEVD